MSEKLFEVFGVTVTVTGVHVFATVVVALLFMTLWLIDRKKRTGKPIFAGQVMNGIGFGLLPGLAVWKALRDIGVGPGVEIPEPLPLLDWLSSDGFFRPEHIEIAAALGCFLLMCLWLILRKKDLPDNGDLLLISVSVWAVIRLVTEDMRTEPRDMFRYASCAALMACLLIWSVRRAVTCGALWRVFLDAALVGICLAVHMVTAKKVLSVGSDIADFAVKTGSAALALLLTLLVGGDLRQVIQRVEAEKEARQNTVPIPAVQPGQNPMTQNTQPNQPVNPMTQNTQPMQAGREPLTQDTRPMQPIREPLSQDTRPIPPVQP